MDQSPPLIFVTYDRAAVVSISTIQVAMNICRRYSTTMISPVVSYGYETWSLALREERNLGVFGNRVLRRIFGSKRDEVTWEWNKTT